MNLNLAPKVAVIIVNWNSGELLKKSLCALQEQKYPIREVIVVDNSSTDSSATGLETYFSNIKVIRRNENIGFAAANNYGVKSVHESEWLALLNPDAFPEPDWLARLIGATQKFPGYSFFGCRMLKAGTPHILDGVGDNYHASGLVWRRGYGSGADNNYPDAGEVFSPCAAAALYRRDAFLDVGGFDEDFFCYVEDVDLGFRLRLAGHRCMLIPDAVVHHVGSACTGGQHSDFSVYHGHRNLVWTFIKNMPGVLFWALLPIHVLLNFVTVVYFAMHGQGKVILRAKRDAIKGIPKMWRKRLEIQANRRASVMDIWRVLDKRLTPSRREKSTQPKKGIL
ncbi:MAG: glycosyltransferase family 2 protein [Deltaproteobacteria bacterium]|nr:glycosyltransferase family 2 protein [Deltaproteobacteria bacterium]